MVKDLLFYIYEITNCEEFWIVNYYLRSMKKAPHGGVFKVFQPNFYLKYHCFQPHTFVNLKEKQVPYFMENLHRKALEIYLQCEEIDLEELLQYCCTDHNWYLGMSILTPKEQYKELNQQMGGMLICKMDSKKYRITDYFDIPISDVIYILLLVLIKDNFNPIKTVDEIKRNENLLNPYNKYGLTLVENIDFLRQGFRIDDKYYLYNIFLDTTINSPIDTMPYTLRVITNEIKDKQLYLRCDNKLAVPFIKMKQTATTDFQKFYGITISFDDIQSILSKEIVVHIHDKLLHKLVMIIKKDKENGESFYHIELEELWNTDKIVDMKIMANFIHSKFYPKEQVFKHIDFSINQYDLEVYKNKYQGSVGNTGVPVDKYGDTHYKIWCVEAEYISVQTWSKLICATLSTPFRELFLEMLDKMMEFD